MKCTLKSDVRGAQRLDELGAADAKPLEVEPHHVQVPGVLGAPAPGRDLITGRPANASS